MSNIPTYLLEYAKDITMSRIELNKERYKGTHKQRTGTLNSVLLGECSREYYTEYIGILAELIIRHRLDVNLDCDAYHTSTLLKRTNNATNDCDISFVIDSREYDASVKGCEGSMKANVQALEYEPITHVIFVVFTGKDTYESKMYRVEDVKKWEIKTTKSPYYYKCL